MHIYLMGYCSGHPSDKYMLRFIMNINQSLIDIPVDNDDDDGTPYEMKPRMAPYMKSVAWRRLLLATL